MQINIDNILYQFSQDYKLHIYIKSWFWFKFELKKQDDACTQSYSFCIKTIWLKLYGHEINYI